MIFGKKTININQENNKGTITNNINGKQDGEPYIFITIDEQNGSPILFGGGELKDYILFTSHIIGNIAAKTNLSVESILKKIEEDLTKNKK